MGIEDIRTDYSIDGLRRKDLAADPLDQFQVWLQQAIDKKVLEPTSMTLSTVSEFGSPSSRIVLLKKADTRGFAFFTNYESRKGTQILKNPNAALNFFWKELQRQVCVEGKITKLSREESKEYYSKRPRGSRLGAWVSKQSQVVENRDILDQEMGRLEEKYPDNNIPLPDYWGGYVLAPHRIEFWQGRPNRVHDRLVYSKADDRSWSLDRLSP
jgi:pyridoxamine 5'-phosphate oxidase